MEAGPTITTLHERAGETFEAYAASLRGEPAARTLGRRVHPSLDLRAAVPETGLGWQVGAGALDTLDAWRHSLHFAGTATAVGVALGRAVSSGNPTAAFEYDFTGELGGVPYSTHACVVFEWASDGVLVGIREYYGDNATPPEAFAAYGLEPVFAPRPGQQVTPGRPPTLSDVRLAPTHDSALEVGQRAYDAFALSVSGGDWSPYIELMDPDVSFTLPIPGRMRGVQHGVLAAEEYHRWRWEDLRMRADLTQQSLMSNGPTIAIEFDTIGSIGAGLPIRHWAIYYFDVGSGKVVGFREYNGDEERAN